MIWKREPALFLGVINAILALLIAFGVADLSTGQTGAILAVSSAVFALITRQSVTPTAKLQTYATVEPQDHYVG